MRGPNPRVSSIGLAIVLAGCATTSAFQPVPTPRDAPPGQAAAQPFPERNRAAYGRAVAAADQGDFARAEQELSAMLEEADAQEGDAAFWIHNEKTWLRWAEGDLRGALDEVDRAKVALARSKLAPDAAAHTGLHEKWDRSYLLLELALKASADVASAANQEADAARANYEAAAAPLDDRDGMAVLSAFFAVRRGDAEAALNAAKRVDADHDGDLQDLYVLALAYDLGHQPDVAERLRQRIRGAKDYLMKPLIVRQMELDRASR